MHYYINNNYGNEEQQKQLVSWGKWNTRKTGTGVEMENGNGNSPNSLQTINLACSFPSEVYRAMLAKPVVA